MSTALGVVGGLVIGAAVGFGVATMRSGHGGAAAPTVAAAGDNNAVLMQLDGTSYKEADLPAEIRANLFEVQEEAHQRTDGVLSQFGLQLALAKDKGKAANMDALPPFDQLLDAPPPSEDEMKTVYEQNKSRLPPDTSFDKIKPEIERYLKNQKMSEALKSKNEELKKTNRLVLLIPTPVAPQVNLNLAGFPGKGPATSPTLVEVADYLCPHCQATEPEAESMLKDLSDKVHFVAVSFSLKPEGLSGGLARGAFCAHQQGEDAFWKYHVTAFSTARSKGWHTTDPDSKDPVLEVAQAAGIDKGKLEACLNSPEAKAYVDNTVESMHKAGVTGTPTFFMNGRKIQMSQGKSLKDNVVDSMAAASH
jgi:protein-disulfide isomerase